MQRNQNHDWEILSYNNNSMCNVHTHQRCCFTRARLQRALFAEMSTTTLQSVGSRNKREKKMVVWNGYSTSIRLMIVFSFIFK